MTHKLPIIYVRGFAGGTRGIDKAVDDPFYGFNEGSTHVRVGAYGKPRFYQFESPLLRLMMDHGYELRVSGDQQRLLEEAESNSLPAQTLWVYRFYDPSASTFDVAPAPYRIEDAGRGLAGYISRVLEKTAEADQVYLVAHSMGGLVCRSAIQRYMYRGGETLTPEQVAVGEGSAPDPGDREPVDVSGKARPAFPVSKVVTYGTPHGGIDIDLGGRIGDWFMETFGPNGSDIFKEPRMRQYLSPEGAETFDPEGSWDPRTPYFSELPAERFLSLVGTNPGDYDVARGWSARAVGVKSDGLVQIENAYVKGSNRAYIHRSHSGRYGLVNSEEGYQNLQRFLFGTLKVALSMSDLDLDTRGGAVWQADVGLAIRDVPVLMHLQSARTHCPVVLSEESRDTPLSPVPLVTTFLLEKANPNEPRRYALDLRVFALRETGGLLSFGGHLEQVADWQDTLLVDVLTGEGGSITSASYQWNSTLAGSIVNAGELSHELNWTTASDDSEEARSRVARIDLPPVAGPILGAKAHIAMGIAEWR